jgi:F-type H+-transporting ATPase subunit b
MITAILNIAFIALFEEEQKGGLLNVNPGLVFWTVITFVILLVLLKKFAWKPILTALDEREKMIQNSLDNAEKANAEAQRIFDENKTQLAGAEAEAQRIIAQSREFAEKLKTQTVEDGKVEAKKLIDNAVSEISRKNEEAFAALRGQVAEIAVAAAEKIIRENLDKQKQYELVNKFIDELPADKK